MTPRFLSAVLATILTAPTSFSYADDDFPTADDDFPTAGKSSPTAEKDSAPTTAPKTGILIEIQANQELTTPALFTVGYRIDKFAIGLFTAVQLRYAEEGLPGNPDFGTEYAWGAGLSLRGRLAASKDARVELFGQGDIGFGQLGLSSDDTDLTSGRVLYFLGLTAEWWLHPHFAIGPRLGIRGESVGGDNAGHVVQTEAGLQIKALL